MRRRTRWGSHDPWETVALIAGLGAFVGAGVAVGGALFFAERRVSGVEGTVEALDDRVSRLERQNAST
jgi:hypothetical protein